MDNVQRPLLVTGANGFVGRNLLPGLLASGQPVRGLVLPGERPLVDHPSLEWIEGDLCDTNSIAAAIDGCGSVIHLAGILANPDPDLNRRVNSEATSALIDCCTSFGCDRFLFMSAAAAKFVQPNAYGQSKRAAEIAVENSGLNWAILRTPLIIGRGSDEFDRFVEFVRKFPLFVPIFGRGDVIKRPVAINDVTAAIGILMSRPSLGNRIYEIACADAVTLDSFVDAILTRDCTQKWKVHVPVGVSLFLAAIAESLLGQRSPITRDIVRGLNESIIFDDSDASVLGLRPRTLAESLDEY